MATWVRSRLDARSLNLEKVVQEYVVACENTL